jgi:hypothetical protein
MMLHVVVRLHLVLQTFEIKATSTNTEIQLQVGLK